MTRSGSRTAVVAMLVATTVAGCGGGGSKASDSGDDDTASPAAEADHVEIESPRDGAIVRATSSLPGSRRARVRVTGTATPNATITLSGGCDFDGCDSVARAGADGRWTGRVWVFSTTDKPSAAIDASTSTSAAPLAHVRLRLRLRASPPQVRATPKPKRKRSRPKRARTPEPAQPTATAPPQSVPPVATDAHRLVLVGDSLAEGIAPLMRAQLPGWTLQIDAKVSRPLATGMQIIAGIDFSTPTVLGVSLFTNDDPRNVSGLEAAVATSVQRVGQKGCAIWATIVRPPVNGVSYRAANARLVGLQGSFAGHLRIVPWAEQVAQHPEWIAGDGVHGTPAGYRARAQMYAQAALACGG
jgi:hypothetical protein